MSPSTIVPTDSPHKTTPASAIAGVFASAANALTTVAAATSHMATAQVQPTTSPSTEEHTAKRADWVRRQQERGAALAREMEVVAKLNDSEDAFWTKQESRYNQMIVRTAVADKTSKELLKFIGSHSRALQRSTDELSTSISLGARRDDDSEGSVPILLKRIVRDSRTI